MKFSFNGIAYTLESCGFKNLHSFQNLKFKCLVVKELKYQRERINVTKSTSKGSKKIEKRFSKKKSFSHMVIKWSQTTL